VAEKLNEPMWLDENGNEVYEEQAAFGHKATHPMVYPSYYIFVDEVGCNMDQEGDGHIAGELKIVRRDNSQRSKWQQMIIISHCLASQLQQVNQSHVKQSWREFFLMGIR